MRLSKGDEALVKNLTSLLQRVSEHHSLGPVKRLIRLNGLVACLQRAAESDPEVVEKMITKLKDPLNMGKKAKMERLEHKRELQREKNKENNEGSKRVCVPDTKTNEVPSITNAVSKESQQTGMDVDRTATQPVDRPNPTRSNPEPQTNNSAPASHNAQKTHRGFDSTSRHSSEIPNQSGETDVRATATGRPRSISRPASSGSHSDDENEADTVDTNTTAVSLGAKTEHNVTDFDHGTAPTNLGESSNDQTDRAAAAASPAPSTASQADIVELVDQREVALISGDEEQKEIFETHLIKYVWPQFEHRLKSTDKRAQHIEEILAMTDQLNFWTIQHDLLDFAERRQKAPGVIARVSDLAKNTDPVAIFYAIEASQTNEIDAKLHRVYGQVRLVRSIEDMIRNGYQPSEATLSLYSKRREHWSCFLSEMVDSICEGEPEETRDKTYRRLCREYEAGRRWQDTIMSFRGEGIVFIFIFASIQCSAVSHSYTAFQRACIEFLFTWIPSMSRLVECFGKNALERFCRLGRLEDVTMDRIRDCEGPKIAPALRIDEMDEDSD
ncbi:MAG: hypothetical protein Q9207_005462 [Kuettlingeria erythrocarpa]